MRIEGMVVRPGKVAQLSTAVRDTLTDEALRDLESKTSGKAVMWDTLRTGFRQDGSYFHAWASAEIQ